MKKKKLLLSAALVLIVALAVWFLLAPRICIAPIEQRRDSHWSLLHVYMSGEYEYTLPVTEDAQLCEFQWVTGRGSFCAEITNTAGAVLYTTEGGKDGKVQVPAGSDLTLRVKAEGHGGFFSMNLLDDPEMEPAALLHTGVVTEGMLRASFTCQKSGGEYLNFYVENRGEDAVIIRINGTHDRTIPAGAAGHISAPIPGREETQDMVVTCTSTGNDGVNIFWKVAQRHE